MKHIKFKPWRIAFFAITLAGGLVFPIMNSTSCSAKPQDQTQKIINRIDVASVDEEKSQLRGAYTRKLIKEGNPNAVSIATTYSNEVNTQVDSYLDDGDVLNAFAILNEDSAQVDVALMEWNNFTAYKQGLLSQAQDNISHNFSGLSKEQKSEMFNNLEAEIDKKAVLAKEQNLSADEFIKSLEDDYASQITSTVTKQAQISKTGIDLLALSDANTLLPVAIAPSDVSLKTLTPGQDITSILPKLFSINSRNNHYNTNSLPGYTATAKIVSIEPTNLYKYKIVVEHSICLSDHTSDPEYKQSFDATYTIASNPADQQLVAQNLLTEANFTEMSIDEIVPYNEFISRYVSSIDPHPVLSNVSVLSQVFNYNKDCTLISHSDSGFFLTATIVGNDNATKTIDVKFEVTNEEGDVCSTNTITGVVLSLTDAEKYEKMVSTGGTFSDMLKYYRFYGDENYDKVTSYWAWNLSYAVIETTLAAVSTGLAAAYWVAAFFSAGGTVALAIGATAQAALSWLAVAFAWVQYNSTADMLSKFVEVRQLDGFIECSKYFSDEATLQQIQDIINLTSALTDINDTPKIRSTWAGFSAATTILISAPILYMGGASPLLAILFGFYQIMPFAIQGAYSSAAKFAGDFGYWFKFAMDPTTFNGFFSQTFHAAQVGNLQVVADDVARFNNVGGMWQQCPFKWLQKLFSGTATVEGMQKAQNILSWASPIGLVVAVVQIGMAIANIIIMKCFKLIEY